MLNQMATAIASPDSIQAQNMKQAQFVLIGFSLFIGFSLLIGAGRFIAPIFPAGSLAVGVFLYLKAPVLYTGFTWWLWFVSPVVRRIIDYQSGYFTPGTWILAALLVTGISVVGFVRQLPKIQQQGGLPFILSFMGIAYGFVIGLIQNPITLQSIIVLLDWINPICFGFFLFINWRDYPAQRRMIEQVFLWGVLVTGVYGIYQFLVAPGWDKFWIEYVNDTADVPSFGTPEPLGIRVSSTLGSPQSFGNVIVAGLPLLFNGSGVLHLAAIAFGSLSFLLSLARAAWLGLAVAMLSLTPLLKIRSQVRLLIILALAMATIVPLVSMEPFADVINSRVESLADAKYDGSLNARTDGYSVLLGKVLVEFIGKGLGGTIDTAGTGFVLGDSTIFPILISLGWMGTLPYLFGLVLILFKLVQKRKYSDEFNSATFAAILGILAQTGFNNILVGIPAMALWSYLGINLAAYKYYSNPK